MAKAPPTGTAPAGKSAVAFRRFLDYFPARGMSAKKTGTAEQDQIREMMVSNKLGIHARPAAMFVKVANQFDSEILVQKDDETVNGKSIMGLMMLCAGPGSRIRVRAKGTDAGQALEALATLVDQKFNED
jgi:phosphocarrier protein